MCVDHAPQAAPARLSASSCVELVLLLAAAVGPCGPAAAWLCATALNGKTMHSFLLASAQGQLLFSKYWEPLSEGDVLSWQQRLFAGLPAKLADGEEVLLEISCVFLMRRWHAQHSESPS